MGTPESDYKERLRQYLTDRGIYWTNVQGGFGVAPGAPDMILCVDGGLEIDMSYGEPRQLEMVETRTSRMQHWLIELRVSFVDVETGARTWPMSYWGEGTDPLDKGLRKAMTAAIKSWLTDLFCIEEGIDPELNGSDESASVRIHHTRHRRSAEVLRIHRRCQDHRMG